MNFKKLLILAVFIPGLAYAQEERSITVTPTLSNLAAHASGDTIGTLLTFSKAFNGTKHRGTINLVTITDAATAGGSFEGIDLGLVLFSSNPSATTPADNTALDVADADVPKIIAEIPITTHKGYNSNDNGISEAVNIQVPVWSFEADGTLYGVLVSRGSGPDFDANGDVTVTINYFVDK